MLGNTYSGYRITQKIGEGGMASIWLGENRLGKRAAIKVLKPELAALPSVRQRFEQEAAMMVNLSHPNIREVKDLVESPDALAIVLEYLEGQDLASWLARHGAASAAQVQAWLAQVLPAVGHAHAQGIVHRDLKPSNLFLCADGRLKVLDFGIAKMLEGTAGLTLDQSMLGSPAYMSPEQIENPASVGPATDLYALGITAYTLLSGRNPYDSATASLFKVQQAIVSGALPPLDWLGAGWQAWLARATAKTAAARFASTADMAQALAALAAQDDATLVEGPTPKPPKPAKPESGQAGKEKPKAPRRPAADAKDSPAQGQKTPKPSGTKSSPPDKAGPKQPTKGQDQAARRWGIGIGAAAVLAVLCWWWLRPSGDGLRPVQVIGTEAYIDAEGRQIKQWHGYADASGKLQLPAIYEAAGAFDGSGVAEVQRLGRRYRIDRQGNCLDNCPDALDSLILDMVFFPKYRPKDAQSSAAQAALDAVEGTLGFFMAAHEVTNAQWHAVMGAYPKNDNGLASLYDVGCPDCPVRHVSWHEAQDFIARLNARTGRRYRLPRALEWTWAAQSAQHDGGLAFAGSNSLDEVAKGGEQPYPVGQMKPNAKGLYDMSGNVAEWCLDSPLLKPAERWTMGGHFGAFLFDKLMFVGGDGETPFQSQQRSALADSKAPYTGFRLCLDAKAAQ